MTLSNRLAEHIAGMQTGDISKSTVHRFIALLRELIEQRRERRKYPLLEMFCDWSLHTKLERSKAGNEALDILDAMWARSKTVDAQFRELLEGISPAKLQMEIASVLAASFIDPSLIYDARWPVILRYLIDDLSGKPVRRSAKALQKNTSERLAGGYRFIADCFYFERENGRYQFVLVSRQIEPPSGGGYTLKCHGLFERNQKPRGKPGRTLMPSAADRSVCHRRSAAKLTELLRQP